VAELIFAQQAVIQLIPIVTPWVLAKVDAIVKSLFAAGKRVTAQVQVGSRAFQIGPQTTKSEITKIQQQIKASEDLSPYKRYALVIGNAEYQDERLSDLKSSVHDASQFADLLKDDRIGAFTQVDVLLNKDNLEVKQSIERFFHNREREDLLLLYFSGHGIRSRNGQLFLAAQNTDYELLRSTGIAANFIKDNMDESFSQRQILILDCCYGGSMVEGAKSDMVIGQAANTVSLFQTSGFGRVIMTASDAMQFAFDGKEIQGQVENSAFTHYLIHGLQSGEADADKDGLVEINELYQYAHRNVIPRQNPILSTTSLDGSLFIGLNPNPTVRPAPLPEGVLRAIQSEDRLQKQGAILELANLLKSPDPSVTLSAEMQLEKLANDDSKMVARYAREQLERHRRLEVAFPEPVSTALPDSQAVAPERIKSAAEPATMPPIRTQPPVYPTTPATAPVPVPVPLVQKSANRGGCLNMLIPGLGHVYAGNWPAAIATFLVAGTILAALLFSLFLVYDPTAQSCMLGLMLGAYAFLFFAGRKAVIKRNQKSGK